MYRISERFYEIGDTWIYFRDRKEKSIANLSILRGKPEHQLKAEIKLLEQIIGIYEWTIEGGGEGKGPGH